MPRIRLGWCMLVAAAVAAVAGSTGAQVRGTAPVTIIVGFAPGGPTDYIARLIAGPLKSALGRPVVIENRPGAGGMIAAEDLKRAAPDGNTLMMAPMFVPVLAPLTHRAPPYDARRDLAPVAQVAKFPLAVAVSAAHPARTLRELLAWLKAHPGQASFGTAAAGSAPHFLGVWMGRQSGIDWVHVPYKGSAPLVSDVLGGQLAATIDVLPEFVTLHKAGKLRILATTGSARSPLVPEVPTFAELGFSEIYAESWMAVYAPGGTPVPVRDALATAVSGALQSPDVRASLWSRGYEPTGTTPDQLGALMEADTARWRPMIEMSGFRAE
jgi:tripartite-type tricarboxylate transporter receptor subunit TctC